MVLEIFACLNCLGRVCLSCLTGICTACMPYCELVRNLDANKDRLDNQMRDLIATRSDMKKCIGEDENNDRMRTASQWRNLLLQARKIEVKVHKLSMEDQNIHKYLCGMCPFLKLEKLSQEIVETTNEVTAVRNGMKILIKDEHPIKETRHGMENLIQTEHTMNERRPELVRLAPVSDVLMLGSLNTKVQEVLGFLKNNKWIAICGDEGIGKTTILETVKVEAKRSGAFGSVFLVSVGGGEKGVKKIQEDLLKQLKLIVDDNNSEGQVANSISEKLKNMTYLLLLDHVHSEINLDEVGLRRDHDYGKVVFACAKESIRMPRDVRVKVEPLPRADAEFMFKAIVGGVVETCPRIRRRAELIVQQLGGVPRLIKAVAKTLKNVDSEILWEYASWILRSTIDSRQQHLEDMDKIFEYVYDELGVGSRRCLLFAALFPEGYKIYDDYLVDCWRIEQLSRGGDGKPLSQVKEREILENLTESSLLERCHSGKYVTMSVKFRKLAIRKFYPEDEACRRLLVTEDEQTINHPTMKDWREAERISLMCNRFPSLPPLPKCRKVSTLLGQRNTKLGSIPKHFFSHMRNLHFLDLYQTGIKSLPQSLFKLINLRGLFLNHCSRLAVLPNDVAKLESLEVLDIRDTAIRWLPCGIRRLRNLKCLRVSFLHYTPKWNILCFHKLHRVIYSNVIKQLGSLEELTFTVDPRIRSWNGTTANIIAKEVASLERLKTLCFYFPDVGSLKTFVTKSTSWEKDGLRSYKMLVGNHEANNRHGLKSSSVGNSSERLLRFSNGQGDPPPVIRTVLKRADAFVLIGHRNVRSLSDFGVPNMESLKVCAIEECNEMSSIVDSTSSAVYAVFPELEKLDIINLQQLNCIWTEPVETRSLVKLRTLTLNNCGSLTRILPPGNAQQLLELQFLRVENCPLITNIIEAANPSAATTRTQSAGYLPKLEILELVDLQGLNCIWRGPVVQGSLVTLRTLTLYKCDTLTYILSHGITQQLEQLQFLRVENCPGITKVIEAENPSTVTAGNLSIYLPMLVILELVDLQILEEVCGSRHVVGWPSLGQIKINQCPALRNLSLSDNLSLNTTDEEKLPVISCSKVWWEGVLQLEQGLRQCLEPLCIFSREEEAVRHHNGDSPNQHPAADTGVLDHTVEENQMAESHASSSTSAALAQPSPNNAVGENQTTKSHASSSMTAVAAQPPPRHTVEENQRTESHASSFTTAAAAAAKPPTDRSPRHGDVPNQLHEQAELTENGSSSTNEAAGPPTDLSPSQRPRTTRGPTRPTKREDPE